MPERFRLTSLKPAKCSIYAKGEKCTVAVPRVLKYESDGICMYLLRHFLAEIAKPGLDLNAPFDFICDSADHPCGGLFRVEPMQTPGETTGAHPKEAAEPTAINTAIRMSYMKVLLRNPFFGPLPIPSLAQIAARLEARNFATHEKILTAGEPGRHFYIILSGECEIVEMDKGGNEKVIVTLDEGKCFGEMSILTGDPVSTTVRAKDDVATLHLSKEEFDHILDRNPSLYRHFLKLLASRLRTTNRQMIEELERGVTGKLSMITLPELAQALAASGRTGTLHLYWRDQQGIIVFSNGQIYDSKAHPLTGEEAFYKMMSWVDGNFKFSQGEVATDRKVPMDTMGLLMEGMRRQDETKMHPPPGQ